MQKPTNNICSFVPICREITGGGEYVKRANYMAQQVAYT